MGILTNVRLVDFEILAAFSMCRVVFDVFWAWCSNSSGSEGIEETVFAEPGVEDRCRLRSTIFLVQIVPLPESVKNPQDAAIMVYLN